MKRDFKDALRKNGEYVTIKYYTRRPGVVNENWQQSEGVVWQYSEVLSLKDVVSQLTFGDSNVANVQFGKTNFAFSYENYDFHGNSKKYFSIIDQNGQVYPIDKIVPMVRIKNGYMAWMAIAK